VLGRRLIRIAPLLTVAVVGGAAVAWAFVTVAPDLTLPNDFFVDFRLNIWEPGRAMLDGHDPIRKLASEENGGIYPPAALVATLPLAAMPYQAAAIAWLVVLVAAVVAAVYLCGVRDWRCYLLALASPPVVGGLAYGNVSLVVVLALAAAWACRDRPWRAGFVLGLVIAARLFVWPVVGWLLFTRRFRAAAASGGFAALLSMIGWSAVAFHRIDEFPEVTRSNVVEFLDQGVSVASIAANLGASTNVAALVALLAGLVALAVAYRQRRDDLSCFSWSIAAALYASPIVWGHYFALMLVPLALSTPSLSRRWLLPYITAPQLTSSPTPTGKLIDAASGIAFTIASAVLTRRPGTATSRAIRDPVPEPVTEH
jgi:hypothetical protein